MSDAGARDEQLTNRTPLLLSIDGTDGRTDTDRYNHPASRTM